MNYFFYLLIFIVSVACYAYLIVFTPYNQHLNMFVSCLCGVLMYFSLRNLKYYVR